LGIPAHQFLRNAFRVILNRDPDPRSLHFFREQLRTARMTPVEVIGHLRRSREGRQWGIRIDGLPSRFFTARVVRRIPFVGNGLVEWLYASDKFRHAIPKDDDQPIASQRLGELGFPGFQDSSASRERASSATASFGDRGRTDPFSVERAGTVFTTLCTVSYLPFARTLIESFLEHHPDIPVMLLVVDLDDLPGVQIDDLGPSVTIVSGRELDVPRFDYLALKYSACDFCCALKSYLVAHAIETTHAARVLFMDADIRLYAPLTAMLDALESSTFVVTPHTLAPIPHPERFWECPTLGDLFCAGTLNAGMFGLTVCEESVRFIETWKELVSGSGAFHVFGQLEQQSFNWVTTWVEGVHVLRDTAYNVAYWNLHDRSLRYRGHDDGGSVDSWTVDGQPLVTFHFSGYSPTRPSCLSVHDRRHLLYLLPSLSRLFDQYRSMLARHGADDDWDTTYAFSQLPSGILITPEMRDLFKQYETSLLSSVSPWTPRGERYYCQSLLSPMPQSGSLLPILFKSQYDQRPDLQTAYPGAHLEPARLLPWISVHGISERDYEDLFNLHRPCEPTREGALLLLDAKKRAPDVFVDLDRPMADDRPELISGLRAAGQHDLAERIRHQQLEYYRITDISLLRQLFEVRPDLRDRFPDLLHDDADALLEWLRDEGLEQHLLPRSVADIFEHTSNGKSVARIFSFVNDHWAYAKNWPLAFVGIGSDELARALLFELLYGRQFDVEDVEMFRWTMIERPWTGLGLTLNLLPNLAGDPSTLYREGQEQLLQPVFDLSPEFRWELRRYRRDHPPASMSKTSRRLEGPDPRVRARARDPERRATETTVFDVIDRLGRDERPAEAVDGPHAARPGQSVSSGPLTSSSCSGVNIFGYFRSPIGLGMMTRGLANALRCHEVPIAQNIVGNAAMESRLSVDEWLSSYDFSFDTNIFVSYPHHHELLLPRLPEEMTFGRSNVAYFAWEQRDWSPYWRHVYGGFDQVWALSEFAAETFRNAMNVDVTAVPCAVDFDAFPEPAAKSSFGFEENRFFFLYVFDANSSIERKNPEAAIRAFKAAFFADERVSLVIKVSNAHRHENRQRIRKMVDAASGSRRDIRFMFDDLPRSRILSLMSVIDCYVSLHRSEGFGYTCAEAMAYAKPVIATNYSGNLHFMNPMNSFLVDYEEVEVATPEGPFLRGSVWAEPDVEQSAHFMRTVYENPDAVRAVGQRAERDVRKMLSYEAVGEIAVRALNGRREG
jgi:glycosyltransferase involved in cell wall biosynthesis